MKGEMLIDPLAATANLLAYILEEELPAARNRELAKRIDSFIFSTRYLQNSDVPFIQEAEDNSPDRDFWELYTAIGKRFSGLSYYWEALDMDVRSCPDPQIGTGDAIDDLCDISREFLRVKWFHENHGRKEALAALRWGYENHLYWHLLPLRYYLEELRFGGIGDEGSQG